MIEIYLELILYNMDYYISFNVLFMILVLEHSLFLGKDGSKRNLVKNSSFEHGKMVIALLNEIIAIYVRLIFINVWGSGFEIFLLDVIVVLWNNKGFKFQNRLENLLQVIFGIF